MRAQDLINRGEFKRAELNIVSAKRIARNSPFQNRLIWVTQQHLKRAMRDTLGQLGAVVSNGNIGTWLGLAAIAGLVFMAVKGSTGGLGYWEVTGPEGELYGRYKDKPNPSWIPLYAMAREVQSELPMQF